MASEAVTPPTLVRTSSTASSAPGILEPAAFTDHD